MQAIFVHISEIYGACLYMHGLKQATDTSRHCCKTPLLGLHKILETTCVFCFLYSFKYCTVLCASKWLLLHDPITCFYLRIHKRAITSTEDASHYIPIHLCNTLQIFGLHGPWDWPERGYGGTEWFLTTCRWQGQGCEIGYTYIAKQRAHAYVLHCCPGDNL